MTTERLEDRLEAFDAWIEELTEGVIEGEYGYEPGEFAVYPELWRPLFAEGLTPTQAFRRALDAWNAERAAADERRRLNWQRIQAETAALLHQGGDQT